MTVETRKHLDLILIWMQSTEVQLNVSLQANETHFLPTGLVKWTVCVFFSTTSSATKLVSELIFTH